MTQPDPEEPRNLPEVDDPYRIMPPSAGSPYRFDPRTGCIEFLSPPGTPLVTSEDVRRWLEDFP